MSKHLEKPNHVYHNKDKKVRDLNQLNNHNYTPLSVTSIQPFNLQVTKHTPYPVRYVASFFDLIAVWYEVFIIGHNRLVDWNGRFDLFGAHSLETQRDPQRMLGCVSLRSPVAFAPIVGPTSDSNVDASDNEPPSTRYYASRMRANSTKQQ